jgi:hypothetical protein
MGAARAVAFVVAVIWWVVYVRSEGSWIYMVTAISFTLAWIGVELSSANRRVDQMIDPKPEDPES